MMRWRVVICGLGLFALTACDSGDSMPTAPSPPPGSNTATVTISSGADIRGADAFGVNPFNVSAGTTVVWSNNDVTSHDPQSDTGAFSVPLIRSGGQGSFTFGTAGTFPYHCGVHPNMRGTIVVQ